MFIANILDPMELRASQCPEFIPVLQPIGVTLLRPSTAATQANSTTLALVPQNVPVIMLREDVWMISFVNIALNKLSNWKPIDHYGRLGLAFTDQFRERVRARLVNYYEYDSLNNDPLTLTHEDVTFLRRHEDPLVRERHLYFRKPAKMTPQFREATIHVRIKMENGVPHAIASTYDRYEIGYEFSQEREARVVKTGEAPSERFTVQDILCLIAPDEERATALKNYVRVRWGGGVAVRVAPSLS